MKHDVVWQSEARGDLFAIADWVIEQADPETAYAYASRIEAFVARLEYCPNRGTPHPGLAPDCRTITFERRVIVIYRVEGRSVRILRLMHTSRDQTSAFPQRT